MVSVPVRVAPGLASKVKVARPLPSPLELVCSQLTLDFAVQAPSVTTTWESSPADGPSIRADVSAGAWGIAPRRLPLPSFVLMTLKVDGTQRSSSASRAGR